VDVLVFMGLGLVMGLLGRAVLPPTLMLGAGSAAIAGLLGGLLGALAGVGAVVLPPYLGLGKRPSRAQPRTALLTVAYYTLAGLGAARATRAMTARAAARAGAF